MTDKELRDAAVAELKLTTAGWLKGNGSPRYPSGTAPMSTHWGKAMAHLAQIGQVAPPPPPPPPSGAHLTGTHFAEPPDYPTIKSIGYDFVVTYVAPNIAAARTKLDAAKAQGFKLVIGLYGFGGPEPYTYSGGQWSISQAAADTINYLETRESEILAFFVFNEPYHTMGASGYPAPLRDLRTKLKAIWPGCKVYHDIGWPSERVTGGQFPLPGGDNQMGVCDYCGIWDYPFKFSGYTKTTSLARLSKEAAFVVNKMGALPLWLGQSYANNEESLKMPTPAQMEDWNCATRAALPAGSLISWYDWTQAIYEDYLKNHPELWPLTLASAC